MRITLVSLLGIAATACQVTGRPTASSLASDDLGVPPATCPDGSPAETFTLPALSAPLAAGAKSDLGDGVPRLLLRQVGGTLRFDTCEDAATGDWRLQAYRERADEAQEGDRIRVVNGLAEALFGGDIAKLEIFVVTKPDGSGVVYKGLSDPEAVAKVQAKAKDGGYEMTQPLAFVYGPPVPGNPWAKAYKLGEMTMGTANLKFWYTTGIGGVGTMTYAVQRLELTDGADKLEAEGDQVAKYLTLKITHHNYCDSFVLEAPFASYAATKYQSYPNECEGYLLPNAPMPASNAQRTLFRVKKSGANWGPVSEVTCSDEYIAFERKCPNLP